MEINIYITYFNVVYGFQMEYFPEELLNRWVHIFPESR